MDYATACRVRDAEIANRDRFGPSYPNQRFEIVSLPDNSCEVRCKDAAGNLVMTVKRG